MSTDQPSPEPGEPPQHDPYRKPPSPPGAGGGPYGGGSHQAGGPYGGGPFGAAHGGAGPLAGMPPLANRGRRLLARIIDGLLVGIPVGLLMYAVVGGYDPMDAGDSDKSTVVQGIVLLAYFIYDALMLTHSGQTVGKRLVRVRVAMLEDGSIPSGQAGWLRAAVYALPQVVPCLGFFFWVVNVLFCTWDRPYHQCLHDKAARTVVVAVP